MRNYVIGIGGTGAKCLETIVHLCAAGLMPADKIHMLFVDPDKANGNLERARDAIKKYNDMRNIGFGSSPILQTRIETSRRNSIVDDTSDVWSPILDSGTHTLDDIFNREFFDSSAECLYNILYSEKEQKVSLEKGFRGHPSIGAAVFANTMDLGEVEPWSSIRASIAKETQGNTVKVFIVGSIFGGTGASGFPTISKLIKKEFEEYTKLKIGGALVLPYFTFTPENSDKELKANSEDFLMNTQSALKYYSDQKYCDIFDTMYLLGDDEMCQLENFSIGAGTQKNKPHLVELCTALAARSFFAADTAKGVFLTSREDDKKIEWPDLADGTEGKEAKMKISQFVRFAAAYLSVYYPKLMEIKDRPGTATSNTWYIDFFEKQKVSVLNDDTLKSIIAAKDYCLAFLKWIDDIQSCYTSRREVKLINSTLYSIADNTFRLLNESNYENLVYDTGAGKKDTLSKHEERLCDARVEIHRYPNASEIGRYLNAVYNNSALA